MLEAMGRGVAVLPSTPLAIRNNDVEHAYRQDSDVYYLTGFDEPETVVVLSTEHPKHRFVLFVRPRDPDREIWDGARAGVDGAVNDFGADAAYPIGELSQRLPEYLENHERLFYRAGRDRAFDDRMFAALDATRARGRTGSSWPTEIVDPATIVHEMRLFKQPDEIDRMRKAASITREAHLGAMRLAKPGRFEYEVEALLLEVFRKHGSERTAYEPIVGSGPNATVLHYRKNDRKMQEGDLLLVDAGCEYGYYASDVTRTWPVSGRFSEPQRAIYEIVLAAQQASIEAVKPGATLDQVHRASVEVIVDGLAKLGLLTGDRRKIVDEQLYKPFYMHRTSHWLGMDVHDVGFYYRARKPRPLEAGMVLTVEPGIYIATGNTNVPPEYRGIGVRIEDDILVTPDGWSNLTADIPRAVADVERACAS
jgi:Xaa-Pro aminopeptidase